MVALWRSRQKKQSRTHWAGTLPATIPLAALIVTLVLVAGCGRTTARGGISTPHSTSTPAATPTATILPEAHLSWMVGRGLPVPAS